MSIEQAKKAKFLSTGYELWEQTAEKSLKGKPIELLNSETYENITISPIYTKKDIQNIKIDQFPGSYVRTFKNVDLNNWKIAQNLRCSDWSDLKKLLGKGLENGLETISLDLDELEDINKFNFEELHDIVNNIPYMIITKSNFQQIAEKLLQSDLDVTGVIATDPLTSGLSQGYLNGSKHWQEWQENIIKLDQKLPNLKTILIDTSPYHNSGSNVVQELAVALAEAVFYIEQMRGRGWETEKTIQKIVFHFSIGSDFFLEIAKLRAFRKLWKTIVHAYRIKPSDNHVTVSAETSSFTKSILDPHVNILRSGNEAFAAILGGVDFLHVTPFDEHAAISNEFSMRIARNTQLLLREESYLNRVIDPAGGSFYIESLTETLVEKAWKFFQEIDLHGGIYSTLESGWLQQKIKETLNRKVEDVNTGKRSLIGVNVYAQPNELLSFEQRSKEATKTDDSRKIKIEPLSRTRLAEAYELKGGVANE
ncbi:methylmalonyl-CoA mutase family protein [Lederbergia citrea]|uniref:methylmalonyl-CoA mutase n=1 Tax=Lederbergia citrea TaxID=2833581 RepID=A0A942Z4G0_9BACI|nr:methylmalonyl-CoA mutase family protein [Lederbergia citrea]MBS4176407.1 methylmalonyl-CoA mutase [Lederbergia citrea]MBS4202968.1 methylmalonyl-CoA mutase [Lederbergia citrea]MBS4222360.1 methylmalonyl-CoA mutase [Lederbergia citrea]